MKAGGKQNLLSTEVSRARALLAGGGAATLVLGSLREWVLRAPVQGSRRVTASLIHWNEQLCSAIRDALPLGAPVGKLLREIHPMIRREERHWSRLQGVERQFAFQGAIAVVLPWAVAGLTGSISMNYFTVAGVGFQLVGLGLFYLILRRATRRPKDEQAMVFDLLLATWMRVLGGMGLCAALEAALKRMPLSPHQTSWQQWMAAYQSGSLGLIDFDWRPGMSESREVAKVLTALLKSGSPSADALADMIGQLDDDRQAALEERLAAVPTRLSLVFCAFLTPAVFLILMGGLWPLLKDLSI